MCCASSTFHPMCLLFLACCRRRRPQKNSVTFSALLSSARRRFSLLYALSSSFADACLPDTSFVFSSVKDKISLVLPFPASRVTPFRCHILFLGFITKCILGFCWMWVSHVLHLSSCHPPFPANYIFCRILVCVLSYLSGRDAVENDLSRGLLASFLEDSRGGYYQCHEVTVSLFAFGGGGRGVFCARRQIWK